MNGELLRALFLSAEANETDGSRVYRCDYQARQLRSAGWDARVQHWRDATPRDLKTADVVVLSRSRWNADVVALIREARGHGAMVYGDLDDRIYCPWAANETGAQRTRSVHGTAPTAAEVAVHSQRKTLRLLPLLDLVIASTAQIREELEGLGIPALLSRNVIDTDTRAPIERRRQSLRRILFMSGTPTHDADFGPLVEPLATFLEAHPKTTLTLLGPVSAPPRLTRLANVRCCEKLPLDELDAFVAEHDLCLCPLEATRFNDCKSALKFIECGLVSVPVVASPRRELAAAIVHEHNGFIADAPEAWLALLEKLTTTPELLARAAREAHRTVLRAHTVKSAGTTLADALATRLRRSGTLTASRGA